MRAIIILAIAICWAGAVGCDARAGGAAEVDIAARPFEHHECAACGMVVRDQPAPRGQLVHRDGTHVYFCSVADMLSYVDVPSPHGKPAALYVELSDAAEDPERFDVAPRPWTDATKATYVTGVKNPLIMGFPILSYASAADGAKVAQRVDGMHHDWTSIRDFHSNHQEK